MEATLFDKGFLAAWTSGARQWREALSSKTGELIPVRSAWETYEASFIDSTERVDVVSRFPSGAKVLARYGGELAELTSRELDPIVADLKTRIAARPTPGLHNRLGAVYARFGVFDKAEAAFREAAKANYAPASYNLGNISFLKKDFKAALSEYEKSLKLNPDSADAAIAVARAAYELGNSRKAGDAFKVATTLDPNKASAFAYVSGAAATSTERASDGSVRASVSWTE